MTDVYKISFPACLTQGKQGFTILSADEPTVGRKSGHAQRRFLANNARSAFSSLLQCGILSKNLLWTQQFTWPSTLFAKPVYPLTRTSLRYFLFGILPRFITGSLQQWLNVDQFSKLHECCTPDCPYHRIKNPKGRKDIEDLVISAAVRAANLSQERQAVPEVHLVSSHVGGLFTEAVLLSRLLNDKRLPKNTHITLSLLGRFKPFVALVNKDEEGFQKYLTEGYNEEFHLHTSAQILSFRQLFLGVPNLTIRVYGVADGLALDINLSDVKSVDVFILVDPGMEEYEIARGLQSSITQAKMVLCKDEGTYIAGHAMPTGCKTVAKQVRDGSLTEFETTVDLWMADKQRQFSMMFRADQMQVVN